MKVASDAILHREQAKYLERLLPPRDEIARSIEEDAAQNDVPIVDPEVGRFLEITARAINAERILEVGTATGYSGLHLARGMDATGELVTIDVDQQRQQFARDHFRQAGLSERVTFVLGPALEMIPTLQAPFDLVFLDAIKTEYRAYLDLALPMLRIGGVIVADNVLHAGNVARDQHDEILDALRDFNRYVMSHPQLMALILPLGDGLLYATKISE
jgi:caffeoyl-CoA O-methyltransferase